MTQSDDSYSDRVYVRSYVERTDIVVTEKDAREFLDPGDNELTDEHWERAARYLSPEQFEGCDLERER